jgi:hypothetical protein
MKTRKQTLLISSLILMAMMASHVFAQLPNVRQAMHDKTKDAAGASSISKAETGKPGTIFFSKAPIDPLNPQNLTNQFKAGDFIYGIAWLDETFRELLENSNLRKLQFQIKYKIDYFRTTTGYLNGEILGNNYLAFEIIPDPATAISYTSDFFEYSKYPNPAACEGPILIANDFLELEPGKNQIEFVLNFNYKDYASGSLTIEGNNFNVYNGIMRSLISGADEKALADARMPQAKMKDAKTEASMLEAFRNSNDWKTGRIKATESLRLVIIDADWTNRYHPISGAIIHRYIRSAIAVKDKDDKCYYYPLVTFQEDYVGGKFQPLKYDGAGDRLPIQCGNVNK